ncbi:hypothetical protein CEXT_654281 [Caerostris extrusa]|uniref:Uncharacterized protein n=1 Tax=Caerostris extrusa TaxID=172846 RepID=A0AAV4XHL8_CAEEX|nr:hypothetical protein CEXT_654281 [Caerostris extrusa]
MLGVKASMLIQSRPAPTKRNRRRRRALKRFNNTLHQRRAPNFLSQQPHKTRRVNSGEDAKLALRDLKSFFYGSDSCRKCYLEAPPRSLAVTLNRTIVNGALRRERMDVGIFRCWNYPFSVSVLLVRVN